MSMNTRIVCSPNTRSSATTGLHVNTSGLSTVGWKHVSEVKTLFVMSCTRCPRDPSTVMIWKGYEINGNTYYTITQDQKSTNRNSGVRFDAATERGKDTYHGYIVDIWELDYGVDFKVLFFKCKWVNLSGGRVQVDPQYKMTTVDLNNLVTCYQCEGHVYQTEKKKKNKETNTSYDEPKCHIVLSGKRDIVGVEGKTDMSEDYEKFHEIPPFKFKADPSILINDEDYPWLRCNKERTQAKKK